MNLYTSLPDALADFATEAQRICAVAGAHLTAYCSGSQAVAGPVPGACFAVLVFDTSRPAANHQVGQLVRQTSYDHATPEAALRELADLLAVDYPLPVEMVSQGQAEDIIRLLNHPQIQRPEKTQMLLKYKRFTKARAAKAIARIRQTIEAREAQPLVQLVPAA